MENTSLEQPKGWLNSKFAMGRYCEPYFDALNRWLEYKEISLLQNRFEIMHSLVQILETWSIREETYDINILSENDTDLLPEYIPESGIVWHPGYDMKAFHASKKLIHESLFMDSGWYFQKQVLKALAGFNPSFLERANKQTRESGIKALEKLFRVSEVAGKLCILFYVIPSFESRVFELIPLSDISWKLFNRIIEYRSLVASSAVKTPSQVSNDVEADLTSLSFNQESNHSIKLVREEMVSNLSKTSFNENTNGYIEKNSIISSKSSNTESDLHSKPNTLQSKRSSRNIDDNSNNHKGKIKQKEKENEDLDEETDWTEDHKYVGLGIAKKFPSSNGKNDIFFGKVVRYLPPSKPGLNDSLFHVAYDDGDSEDMSDSELEECCRLYMKQPIKQTKDHKNIEIASSSSSSSPLSTSLHGETLVINQDRNHDHDNGNSIKRRRQSQFTSEYQSGIIVNYGIGKNKKIESIK